MSFSGMEKIRDGMNEYYAANPHYAFDPAKPVVRLHESTYGIDEVMAATGQLLSTWVTMGKKVKEFEAKFAGVFGSKYGMFCNSGSSSNLLMIAGLMSSQYEPKHGGPRLQPGDEVLVPALSWATTVWPLFQHGLVPVFVDCDLNSLNMDTAKLEAAIGPKTRAMMIIHTYGNPMDMDVVTDMCKYHNLLLIEDNCESMGASFKGKQAGTFGVAGSMSTYFSHHITTMEGGLIVTDDYELMEAMRLQRAHGWSREADRHAEYMAKYPNIDPRFIFVDTGYNLRPTEVQAAMGLLQIDKLGQINAARREAAAYLNSRFAEWNDLFTTVTETPGGESVWFGYCVQIKDGAGFDVRDIRSFLESKGIETRPVIAGNMTRHPVLNGRSYRMGDDMPNANKVMDCGFAIPCHHAVKGAAATYMANCIAEFVSQRARKAA